MNSESFKTTIKQYRVSIVSAILLSASNIGFITGNVNTEWFQSFCSFMEFDRSLILKGEIWRLLTCHLVHWSPQHFFLDALVFIALGFVFEKKIGRRYWEVLAIASMVIGLTLLIFQDGLSRYRGISGLINTQFVLGMGLFLADRSLKNYVRGFYVILFSIHISKIAYETYYRVSFFHTDALGNMGHFTPLAHLSGALVGLGYLFVMLCLSGMMSINNPVMIKERLKTL